MGRGFNIIKIILNCNKWRMLKMIWIPIEHNKDILFGIINSSIWWHSSTVIGSKWILKNYKILFLYHFVQCDVQSRVENTFTQWNRLLTSRYNLYCNIEYIVWIIWGSEIFQIWIFWEFRSWKQVDMKLLVITS